MKGVESVIPSHWSSGLKGNVPSPVPVTNTSCLLQLGVTHCSPNSTWQGVLAQVSSDRCITCCSLIPKQLINACQIFQKHFTPNDHNLY